MILIYVYLFGKSIPRSSDRGKFYQFRIVNSNNLGKKLSFPIDENWQRGTSPEEIAVRHRGGKGYHNDIIEFSL